MESLLDTHLNRDEYDIRELQPDPFPYGFFVNYLNSAPVQAAIGAYTNFSTSTATVANAFSNTGDDGREAGTIEAVAALLGKGVSVAMYAGDADYNCNWLGGQIVAETVGACGWEEAGFVNITTSDNEVHGQVKQSGKFSFSRVYQSGHEVPFYKPLLALEMFERVINGWDVATGKTAPDSSYHTVGPAESTFRDGNSTMQWEVIPDNTTYDTITGKPEAPWKGSFHKRSFKPRLAK